VPHYPYTRVVPDSAIPFTSSGLRQLEEAELLKAFGKDELNAQDEAWLKDMTGCQTFLEFRERIFSPHQVISHELSILLIESVDRGTRKRPAETLTFRALLMSAAGECVALVRRRLNRLDGVVDHNMLEVRPRFGGQGVASVVAQSHEDAWEAAGYREVALTAGELEQGSLRFGNDVYEFGMMPGRPDGRVFWALQGFDFNPKKPHHGGAARIRSAILKELSRAAVDGLVGQELVDYLTVNIYSMSTWDAVAIQDDHGTPIGEQAFRMFDWEGFKVLNAAWPGNDVAVETREAHLKAHPFPRKPDA